MKDLFGTPCHGCGKPVAFSLGQPDGYQCDACGAHGRHPPEVAHQLREAGEILQRTDVHKRQLGSLQRFSLRASGVLIGAYLLVLLIVFVPAACSAGCAAVQTVGGTTAGMLMTGIPPLILFPSGIAGLLIMLRTRRRLRTMAAAIPPAIPGAPARCRVCGGPLETTSADVVVRCRFCHADSLVDARVLDNLRGTLGLVTDHFAAAVSRSAAAIGSGLAGLVVLPFLVLVVPVGSFLAVASLFVFYLDDREDPPDMTERYVVEEVPQVGLQCIGLVKESGGKPSRLNFGFLPREVDSSRNHTRSLSEGPMPQLVPVTQFVGRTVFTQHGTDKLRDRPWKVVGAFKPPLYDNNILRLRSEDKHKQVVVVQLGRAMVCFPPTGQ